MTRPPARLRDQLIDAGLHLADVPVEFSRVASRSLCRRIGAEAMARMHHLMNGAPVVAPHLVTEAGRAPRVWFLVAQIKRSPTGQILGPVWIDGGPLKVTYLALAEMTHRDCLICRPARGHGPTHVPSGGESGTARSMSAQAPDRVAM
ncbi:hypothetical protein [Luteipulveratus mongoliensis]|uniref:Uncharacterized protein n=1 Tax=Luteipulveratus mongoliensis TaxID=571913 RepID=A0A0K1JEK9_9MICO|nr:hypothetical protein [Luteipulveratus mongoliensis]AKU15139.1 hypothetical protein VV02_03435 [Luteipulveratus mongoliensis]